MSIWPDSSVDALAQSVTGVPLAWLCVGVGLVIVLTVFADWVVERRWARRTLADLSSITADELCDVLVLIAGQAGDDVVRRSYGRYLAKQAASAFEAFQESRERVESP